MEDFRAQFVSHTGQKLDRLIVDLGIAENTGRSFKSKVLRTLHTVKGSAQIFGFQYAGILAHKLEDYVSGDWNRDNFYSLLSEGLEVLKNSLAESSTPDIQEFLNKLGITYTPENRRSNLQGLSLLGLPGDIFLKLSEQERSALQNEIDDGKTIYCAETKFSGPVFSSQLKAACELINESGKLTSTIPQPMFGEEDVFGFHFLFTTDKTREIVLDIAGKIGGEITYCSNDMPNDVRGVIDLIVSDGKEIAKNLGKSVEIEVSFDCPETLNFDLQVIFDSLLHIVRNAVIHAFENKGTVQIQVKSAEKGISLSVSDDGQGIDLDKVRAAAERITPKTDIGHISDQATLELIFQSEFSTALQVTEVSGRGVGLNAVKATVENAGGTICLESKLKLGTTFVIFLPHAI